MDTRPDTHSAALPDVAKRLSKRHLLTQYGAWELYEKQGAAHAKREEALSPTKAIEHNQKVLQASVRAAWMKADKRQAIDADLKRKMERATAQRKGALEEMRQRMASEDEKRARSLQLLALSEEQRKQDLCCKLTTVQLLAAEKRRQHIRQIKSRGAGLAAKRRDGDWVSYDREESRAMVEAMRREELEQRLASAKDRREELAAQRRSKLARSEELNAAAQRRRQRRQQALQLQLEDRNEVAALQRKAVLADTRARAIAGAKPRGPSVPPPPPPPDARDKLLGKTEAADQRRRQQLMSTTDKAAAVAKKAADILAAKQVAEQEWAERSKLALDSRILDAAARRSAALRARQLGLSSYIRQLAVSTANTPRRGSPRSSEGNIRRSFSTPAELLPAAAAVDPEGSCCDAARRATVD